MKIPTLCPICNNLGNAEFVYPSNVDESSFSTEVFSARRLPDRQHYQWVRCKSCGLLRSDPILEVNLSELYKLSTFDYSTEIAGLKKTYLRLAKKALDANEKPRSVFEVGGGNGFFLEAALDYGFMKVAGVEPSFSAIASAREDVKPHMIASMMNESALTKNSFQLGAMFHTLDHLQDPLKTLKDCLGALESGGKLVVAVHNERSWSARLLGERSPIIDVEHTYLYSFSTAKEIFKKAGFVNVTVGSYMNHYSLAYIFHLLPISRSFRKLILDSKLGELLTKVRVVVPLGNMWVYGVKP